MQGDLHNNIYGVFVYFGCDYSSIEFQSHSCVSLNDSFG
jgi:hypothetical protein